MKELRLPGCILSYLWTFVYPNHFPCLNQKIFLILVDPFYNRGFYLWSLLNISRYRFDCLPMSSTRISHETANNSGSMSIHKWTISWCIQNILHVIGFIIIFGTIILWKVNMWLQWRSKRLSISQIESAQHFFNVLFLGWIKVYCSLSLLNQCSLFPLATSLALYLGEGFIY